MFPFDAVSFYTLLNCLQGLRPLGLVRQSVTTEARSELIRFSDLYIDTPGRRLHDPNNPGDLSFFVEPNAQCHYRGTTLNDYISDFTIVSGAVPNHHNHFEISYNGLGCSPASAGNYFPPELSIANPTNIC